MINNYSLLQNIAEQQGTPFWLYDESVLKRKIRQVQEITSGEGLQARFAMKACSATRILREMKDAGIWIDAVSGNEILRALHAGFAQGHTPPEILYTSDVFRDNALDVVLEHGILPNLGSPRMVRDLTDAGYIGPIALRINPGFGHGHVNECDTGGPSSKHGIWHENMEGILRAIRDAGLTVKVLHSHIGSGPQLGELLDNLQLLTDVFVKLLPDFPDVEAVSLGGGIPHNYRPTDPEPDLSPLKGLLESSRHRLCEAAGRDLRVEIEPGRYFVAGCGNLVTRVKDVKETRDNPKGQGVTFAMVDAGFVDLVRPVMYGSYHHIDVVSQGSGAPETARIAVAGPMCESGDVFTQGSGEMIMPREMPLPEPGDFLILRDAGAYGYAMSSNYNSLGRPPQLMLCEDGSIELFTRRETLADLLKTEVQEKLHQSAVAE